MVSTVPLSPSNDCPDTGLVVANGNGAFSSGLPNGHSNTSSSGLPITNDNRHSSTSLSGLPVTHSNGVANTASPELAVANYGSRLLVTDFLVIVERTLAQSGLALPSSVSPCLDTDLQLYLHPVAFTAVSAPPASPALGKADTSGSLLGSFIVSTAEGERKVLYFQVRNKNIAMSDPVYGFKFTCIALVHYDTLVLSNWSEGRSESEGRAESEVGEEGCEHPLEIAIFFRGEAFKWYSVVCSGSVYSLKLGPKSSDVSLPPWKVLATNRSLTVTEDMVVQYVGGHGTGRRVQDVADLVRQLHVPLLRSVNASSQRKRYICHDNVDVGVSCGRGMC